ncbi:hypothetical protein [Thermoflexus hugenholtzii]
MTDTTTVGDLMGEAKRRAFKALAIFMGIAVYAGMLLYAGVHNYSLFVRGLREDLVIFALLGLFTMELSAVGLPLAIHFWTAPGVHRIAALAFYLADLALLAGNAVLDFHLNAGLPLTPWMRLYLDFMAPATPLLVGLMWSVLFILDPANRIRDMEMELAAAARMALANRIAEAAKAADVNEIVEGAAREMARDLVARAVGRPPRPLTAAKPSANGAAPEPDTERDDETRPIPKQLR